jgi:triosephosphate isomerase
MTVERRPLVVGNWKMHKTIEQAEQFIQALLPRVSTADHCDVAICPPFTALQAMVDSVRGSRVEVYAQTMHHEAEGPFTGEVGPAMLTSSTCAARCSGTPSGREFYGEIDETLTLKVPAALAPASCPVLCVGETETERERGEMEGKLRMQVSQGLEQVATDQLSDVVLAYEPIWAIGTGRTASPEQAQEACACIRSVVAEQDPGQAARIRILYGGSVKQANAAELIALEDVDGALVGGASLDPQVFASIVAGAS